MMAKNQSTNCALIDPFERFVADIFTPVEIRAAEQSGDPSTLWASIEASGFLDLLVAEEAGGAGLSFAELFDFVMVLGRYCVPIAVAGTLVARSLLHQSGDIPPPGGILLAVYDASVPAIIPGGLGAAYVLWDCGDHLMLSHTGDHAPETTGVFGSLSVRLSHPSAVRGVRMARPDGGLLPIIAVINAALIAGAGDRVLSMTVDYANQRVQFGKAIGQQQALQQQMAVMAEQCVAVRIAAELGMARGFPVPLGAAATAKITACAAASLLSATAHAVHGAIGISADYDLQLFTRRLHEWRMEGGGAAYWSEYLGRAYLSTALSSVDDVRFSIFGERDAQ
jgi:acyl-CoA dehydrogenase